MGEPDIYIPANKNVVYMDKQMFATIVSLIPAGKLTTMEDICSMWAKRKGADRCEVEGGFLPIDRKYFFHSANVRRVDFITDMNDSRVEDKDDRIPYWRLISRRGCLIDFGHYTTKEAQRDALEGEGHVIIQPNPKIRRYVVRDYKNALMDLDRLIIME